MDEYNSSLDEEGEYEYGCDEGTGRETEEEQV